MDLTNTIFRNESKPEKGDRASDSDKRIEALEKEVKELKQRLRVLELAVIGDNK